MSREMNHAKTLPPSSGHSKAASILPSDFRGLENTQKSTRSKYQTRKMVGRKKQNELKMCQQYYYCLVKHATSQSRHVYHLARSNITTGVKRMKKWAVKGFALVHVSFSLRRQPHYLPYGNGGGGGGDWLIPRVCSEPCTLTSFIIILPPPALYVFSLSLTLDRFTIVRVSVLSSRSGVEEGGECYSYWLRKGKQTVGKDNS